MYRHFLALILAAAAGAASAQLVDADPDWKELQTPPPPPLNTSRLIGLEMPASSLRFGVDPGSVSIGADGVVRYVVVATSTSGTVNAMYEGVRCSTGEVKVYARHNPDSGWVPATKAEWQPLQQTRNSRHSLLVARTGACIGHAPNRSPEFIVRDLKSGPDLRFLAN
ncbi:CNP1-like family protein [Ramlibacter sp.]|uniref:CNP1-like family protein n=1 Tax=Ramlibacter sp. TaxID=1917967 RepID=UPI0026162CE0|nr:CNP1-like family protein [Ramlibacter sp.]